MNRMAVMSHIVITGATRGIGRHMARQLLAKGWRVTATFRGGNAPEGADAGIMTLAERPSIHETSRYLRHEGRQREF